jgi:AcrR family transcriptional regulator
MKPAKGGARPASAEPAPSNSAIRARVLKAAFSAFRERGFADTSMLEIATRARVSKRDLYALYDSKHALLADCIGERARAMRGPLDPQAPLPASGQALAARLIELGTSILRGVCQPAVLTVYRLTIAESDRAPEIARILDSSGRETNHRALAELLAKAQAQGLVGDGEPSALAARYFAVLWGDLLIRLLIRVRQAPADDEIEERARTATATLGIRLTSSG